jgi:hypothetical protein
VIVRHINSFSPQPLPAKVWAYSWECLIESRDQEKKNKACFCRWHPGWRRCPRGRTIHDLYGYAGCASDRGADQGNGRAGCEIVRVAVPDMEAAAALADIRKQIRIPLIADIHFNHRLALQAMKNGVDGIRINPGNMGVEKVKTVIKAAKSRNVVIRIGINAGSLEKELLTKYGGPTPDALVESALKSIALFEAMDFNNIKLSLKSSNVATMIEAYRAGRR